MKTKKALRNFILGALMLQLFIFNGQAQFESKNIAKVNLSAFALKGYSIQYERQLSHRLTAAVGYASIPYNTIAYQSIINNFTKDGEVAVGNFKLGTSVITPELRYYVGKKGAFRGFYLAPYARFSDYKMEVPIAFNSGISKRNANFSGKIDNVTGGLMLGSQFKLSERLYLDWWIIGASIGSANGTLVAATPLNPLEQQDLRNQLANIEIPFTKIKYEVNNQGATVTTTGSMVGARGLGLNLGIRF
jgi:hypothetical protein